MSQNDPQVQKNGFETILESVGVDPSAMKDWFEGTGPDGFDPSRSWEENVRRFREHLQGANDILNQRDQEEIEELLDDVE